MAPNFLKQGSSKTERNGVHHAPDSRKPPVRARKGRIVAAPRADRGRVSPPARREGRPLGSRSSSGGRARDGGLHVRDRGRDSPLAPSGGGTLARISRSASG